MNLQIDMGERTKTKRKILTVLLPWLLLIVALIISVDSCQQKQRSEKLFRQNLSIARDSIKHLYTENGQLINQVRVIKIEANRFKYDAVEFGLDNKKLRKEIGKLSNLVSHYKGTLVTEGSIEIKGEDSIVYVTVGDTTKKITQKVFASNGKYLSLFQVYNPIWDSLRTDYRYTTNFTHTTFYKKEKLLLPKQMYANFTLEDPNAYLSSGQAVLIVPPSKRVYERNWFWGAIGFVMGLFVNK